ncbi:MAG: potassium transporter TrkG [Chlorobiota bacterium]
MQVPLRTEQLRWVWHGLNGLLLLCGGGALALIIGEVGFARTWTWLEEATRIVLVIFVLQELLRVAIVASPGRYLRQHWLEAGVALVVGGALVVQELLRRVGDAFLPGVSWERVALVYLVVTQALVLGGLFVRVVRHHAAISRLELHPAGLLLLSFVALSFLGAGLLLLPAARTQELGVLDALFTATSAVCVTGLTVVDTATHFTLLGHLILLVLIQVGGLGLMTFMSFFGLLFTGGLGVRERLVLREAFAVESLAEVRRLLVRIVGLTLLVEGVGVCLLYWSDGGGLPLDGQKAFQALFHAVSAFCNAGFSLYSANLVAQQHNLLYLATILALVVLGGLGFPVLSALLAVRPWAAPARRLQRRLPVSAKLVLLSTLILLLGGTVLLWVLERDGVFREFSSVEQWFQALFLATVPRTAGFNSVPIDELSVPASLVVVGLMWIGASPASTGGGVKTLTVAVAVIGVVQLLQGRDRVELFHRELPLESVLRALAAVVASAAFLLSSAFCLQMLEPDRSWIDVLFETASALGTVGLSRGITAELNAASKLLLCLVMLVGRVGVLSVLLLLIPTRSVERYRYPQERVIIT